MFDLLKDFRTLTNRITTLTEDELQSLIAREKADRAPRASILLRLHQRFCTLRAKRERKELLGE